MRLDARCGADFALLCSCLMLVSYMPLALKTAIVAPVPGADRGTSPGHLPLSFACLLSVSSLLWERMRICPRAPSVRIGKGSKSGSAAEATHSPRIEGLRARRARIDYIPR